MRNLIERWFSPDDHGEIPAVVFYVRSLSSAPFLCCRGSSKFSDEIRNRRRVLLSADFASSSLTP